MIRPSQNPVTLPFGATTPPYSPGSPHIGVDFSPLPDNKIYSPEAGAVECRPNDGTCGRAIHMFVGNRHHAFCHTSQYLVSDGQQVSEGQAIAIMGDTGFAQGVHLHWALTVNGTLVDPLSQVKGEEMFNEGDRVNINQYLYGKDMGRFHGAVGKDWKNAMYYGVFETTEFKTDQLINTGDVPAINQLTGRTDGSTQVGKTWKDAFEYYFLPNASSEYIEVTDKLYKKK